MSSRSARVLRSVSQMIGLQLFIGIGQLLYSAVTARVFAPSEFGAFAAILGLQGLVILLATTGLPSYALKERQLGKKQLRALNILATVGALISTLIFFVTSPFWLSILNAEAGQVFVPLMMLTVFVSPFSAVQSALFRRESRPNWDRRILSIAFLVSNGSGLILILFTRDLWSLAWAALMNPVIVLILSMILRKTVINNISTSTSVRIMLKFSTKVTIQNTIFYVIGQFPSWIIGAVLGPTSMGNFSRATALTSLPSAAISSGLSRVIQPLWRHIDGTAAHLRAASEATILAALFSFPFFGLIAATGPELALLWLGPGWEIAGMLTPLLAIAFGLQIPYVTLAGSCEMKGQFAPGRISQYGMISCLVVFLGSMVFFDDVIWAGVALVVSQLCGLFILSIAASKSSKPIRAELLSGLTLQMLSGLAVGFTSWSAVRIIEHFGGIDTPNTILAVVAAFVIGGILFLFLLRWNSAVKIIQQRGIRLPARLTK